MGQGLSSLQHFVLKQTAKQGVLFRDEIKEQFFDWKKPDRPVRISASLRPFLSREHLEEERRDNVVSASTCRTVARLERRGLINAHQSVKKTEWYVRRHDAIVLTAAGRKYVKKRFRLNAKRLKKSRYKESSWLVLPSSVNCTRPSI